MSGAHGEAWELGVKHVVQEDWFKKILINNGPVSGLLTQAETATGVNEALSAFLLLNILNHRVFPCCSSHTKAPIVRSGLRISVCLCYLQKSIRNK